MLRVNCHESELSDLELLRASLSSPILLSGSSNQIQAGWGSLPGVAAQVLSTKQPLPTFKTIM